MSEKKPEAAVKVNLFTVLPEETKAETNYPTRGEDNKKLDVADLFTHFTANIIRENTLFTR